MLVVPFTGGWRVDIQCKESDDPDRLCSEEVLGEMIARILGERYRSRVSWVSEYKFKQVTANSFVDDHRRVLLAGEAAHLFAPYGARGMNSGSPTPTKRRRPSRWRTARRPNRSRAPKSNCTPRDGRRPPSSTRTPRDRP
ncbi:FAD-dependent monooxygenase [Halorussus caseinilyticus]|uniref:FAD-dependent monooxygenase n=1 Tax=Halorussus caseinilyticus TaxID=3034025 RepID=A0ABD5WIP0_9EURY